MATIGEINESAALLATEMKLADNALSDDAKGDLNISRPHMMRALIRGLAPALEPPWAAVEATNSSNPEAARLAPSWFNKGAGWGVAMIRKAPLLGTVTLRGYVYTAVAGNALILTLPPLLRPAQNELFATVIDYLPAYINVWLDGTVSVWYAEATTRQLVTLSGISFEAAL